MDSVEDSTREIDSTLAEARWQALSEASADRILTLDADNRVRSVHGGGDASELLGHLLIDVFSVDQTALHEEQIERARRTGAVTIYEAPCPGGRWCELRVVPTRGERAAGEVLMIVRDLGDRSRTAQAARETEARYRLLFDHSPLAKLVYDAETLEILDANRMAVQLYGYPEVALRALTLRALIEPADLETFLARSAEPAAEVRISDRTTRHRRQDGATLDVEMSHSPLVVDGRRARFATIIDVTERKRLEQQFRQAQKMDAVGRLAGGVAHDFNNLLAVIMSCTEFLVADLPDGDPKLLDVLDIRHAGERAASLTRQLLVFSRKQILQPAPMSLNDLVGEVGKLLKRLIGEDIRFVTVLRPELGRVMADRGQMEQVLVNLVVNARDAMTSGGSLLVETSNVDLGVEEAARVGAVAPGPYVALMVKDTGCGMDEDTLSKVFEPFFTTKELGKGTGLGLSTVFGIVRQSQGTITVESRLGQGAVFRVFLPRIDGDVPPSSTTKGAARRSHGAETVLLVEDDEQVRAVVRRILKSRGYQVIEAKDGGAALSAYERDPEGIDIVVTDLVIPGFDGVTIASELQTRTPRVKVLYMSGYTEHTVLRRGVLEAGVNFIQKPFSGEELALMVRKVLDASGGSRGPPEASPIRSRRRRRRLAFSAG